MVPMLQQSLPIVGAAIGRKLGVQVEVAGSQAFTDGQRIVLPAFDPEQPSQELKAWGFLHHEAAHVRYTDFELDQGGSAFRQRLTNLIEDIRIEQALSREYPGTTYTLSEVVRQLVAEGSLVAPEKSDPPVKVLHDSLLAMLRYEVLGQKALKDEAAKAAQAMKNCFPASLLKDLNAVLDEVPKLDSTHAALDMADRIISLFQNRQDYSGNSDHTGSDDKTNSQSSDLSDNQEPNFDSVSPQGADDKTDSPEPADQPAVNTPCQQQQEQQEEDETDSTQGDDVKSATTQRNGDASEETNTEAPTGFTAENIKAVLESNDCDWPDDTFEQLSEELASWSAGQEGGLSAITTTPSADRVEVIDIDRDEGRILLSKTKTESARLAAQLTGLVQAKTLCRDRTGKRGRKLDGKRLHRVAVGDSRLFCKRSEAIAIDAAVHLCLDISSSMASRMELAREAVLALAYALNQINGVTVSVSAYPGKKDSRVFEIMKPNDRLQDVATGLWQAVHQVIQTKAKRRLIIMITDDAPDCDHDQPVIDLVKRCKQSGIDVVGLGINVNSVETLFPQSVVITQLYELKSALFEHTRLWLAA